MMLVNKIQLVNETRNSEETVGEAPRKEKNLVLSYGNLPYGSNFPGGIFFQKLSYFCQF